MKTRITMHEAVFYILYRKFREKPGEYVPVHALMGEVYCEEVKKWGYVSHECSARASELRAANPKLIQHTEIRGKSGATYYGYRINPEAKPEMIQDCRLLDFYRSIVGKKFPVSTVPSISDEGKEYTLYLGPDKSLRCTCAGFTYRKTCRHVEEHQQMIKDFDSYPQVRPLAQ